MSKRITGTLSTNLSPTQASAAIFHIMSQDHPRRGAHWKPRFVLALLDRLGLSRA